jgi:CheY-like chemotaxis protein/glycine cleavage system H lipoate-binding protein
MSFLIVVLMFVAFIVADAMVREALRRARENRERRQRQEVLETAVRLDFAQEAASLKRVEVPGPKARILAVDDEPVVLDSFRRILVLEGYNVDTVESGPEALHLIQRHDYDFVFTDLKMPDMDGVEVVKAVKHLRPDVDVVVITGYGTIETAVETLQHGACEYMQKPFAAEELAEFVQRILIKRQARLEAHRKPAVRIVSPATAEESTSHEYCVPGGAFLAPGHAWARIEAGGQVRVGLDDFARKLLVAIDAIELPERGKQVQKGEPLFTLKLGREAIRILAPLSGKVVHGNPELKGEPALVMESPYDRGWVCLLEPQDLATELPSLKIGKPVVAWYQEEAARLGPEPMPWNALEKTFFRE